MSCKLTPQRICCEPWPGPGQVEQIPEKVSDKVCEALVQSQVLQGSGKGFFATLSNLTWFCTKTSQTFSGIFSGTFSGTFSRTLLNLTWLLAQKPPSTSPEPSLFGAKQVRFNKVPENVPEKVPEKVWEALVQSQDRFNRICGHATHGNLAEVFPALGCAARFRKICKNKTLRLLGIQPKFIFFGAKASVCKGVCV